MNQYATVPEYTVQDMPETVPTGSLPNSNRLDLVQIAAEVALLSKELDISIVILGKIRESLEVLQHSVEHSE